MTNIVRLQRLGLGYVCEGGLYIPGYIGLTDFFRYPIFDEMISERRERGRGDVRERSIEHLVRFRTMFHQPSQFRSYPPLITSVHGDKGEKSGLLT